MEKKALSSGWRVHAHSQVGGSFLSWDFDYLELYMHGADCGLSWALFRFTGQINEFRLLHVYVGVCGSPASHLGALLSLVQAEQFQNELLNHFFIMNVAPSPRQIHSCHWHQSDRLGEDGKGDLRGGERGSVMSNWASDPKRGAESTDNLGELSDGHSRSGKMRPAPLTLNHV